MLIVLSGPSSIGKNWLLGALAERGVARIVTPYTTRDMRADEVQGVDYHYVGWDDFQERIVSGFFDEWDYVIGNYYGCAGLQTFVESRDLYAMHALSRMALRIRGQYPTVRLVALKPSSVDSLEGRIMARSASEEEFGQRMGHVAEELVHAPMFDLELDEAEQLGGGELDDFIAGFLEGR